jgi:hypothetical protein
VILIWLLTISVFSKESLDTVASLSAGILVSNVQVAALFNSDSVVIFLSHHEVVLSDQINIGSACRIIIIRLDIVIFQIYVTNIF